MSELVNKDERSREVEWALINDAIAWLRASIMAVVLGLTSGTVLIVATAWLNRRVHLQPDRRPPQQRVNPCT